MDRAHKQLPGKWIDKWVDRQINRWTERAREIER